MVDIRFGWSRRPGLTLIDLVIVVLIMGILTAVATPKFADALHGFRADAAAKRIVADLKLARREAKTRGSSRTLQFNVSEDSYQLLASSSLDRSGVTYTVNLAGAPYGAALVSADFGGDNQVVINGFGIPDSGGKILVASGSHQRTVTLEVDAREPVISQ